jgi:hypothetical protein
VNHLHFAKVKDWLTPSRRRLVWQAGAAERSKAVSGRLCSKRDLFQLRDRLTRMTEKIGAKSLYNLAKALGRWDNEGGATAQAPEHPLKNEEERILRCLGAAVIMGWNDLPTEIQRQLFEDATSIGDPGRKFQLKQLLAQFLHDHKDDA